MIRRRNKNIERTLTPSEKAGGVILAILLWPFFLIYGLYLFFVGFKERKAFKRSPIYQKLGLSYKHPFFKSDLYSLGNVLLEQGIQIEIRHYSLIIIDGKAYEFAEALYFTKDDGEPKVSYDGEPHIPLSEYLAIRNEANGLETYILTFRELCLDLENEPVVFADPHVLIGADIEDLADLIMGAKEERISEREAFYASLGPKHSYVKKTGTRVIMSNKPKK